MKNCRFNFNAQSGGIIVIKEVKNFERMSLFKLYDEATNPFLYITVEIDVTNIVKFCKKNKNFYATMGFLVTKTNNCIDAFKYRAKDGKIFYCNNIKSNYTQRRSENEIGFFSLPLVNKYAEYIDAYKEEETKFLKNGNTEFSDSRIDEVWLSCYPWSQFTGIVTPFRKSVTIPQFIWDKFVKEKGRYRMHLMIMAHHGLVDGGHIAEFIKILEQNIANFPGNIRD